MTTVRHALRSDLNAAADVLADAFAKDPWLRWLYPTADEWPHEPKRWFSLVTTRAFTRGHSFVTDSGFACWIPPDVHFPEAADIDVAVDLLRSQTGERADVWLDVVRRAGSNFHDTPRFHCAYIGVNHAAQGRGIGASLMSRVLDVCDREGLPASLTSTNDVNLPWYRSLGFNELGAADVPGAGFSLRPMWREPRTLA